MINSPCETCEGMLEQVRKYREALEGILNECLYNADNPKKALREVNKIAEFTYGSNEWNLRKVKIL